MKALALLLTITLLFTWYAPAHADVGVRGVRPDGIIEVTPSGFQYKESIDPQGKSRITVVKQRIISFEEYSRIANLANTQAASDYVVNKSWTGNPEVAGTINRFFNNSKLFMRGFADVWKASSGGMFAEQGNLTDPEKKYEYWQKQGIYDKYTASERAFLNKVVFPAVAVARSLYGGAAIAMAAAGVATLAGVAVAPVALAALGVWAGLTGYKVWKTLGRNAGVAGMPQWSEGLKAGQANWYTSGLLGWAGGMTAGAASLLRNAIGNPVLQVAADGTAALGEGIGLGTAVAGVASTAVAGYIGINESFNIVRLVNEWGIPEKTALTEAEFTPQPGSQTTYETLYLNYRLTK